MRTFKVTCSHCGYDLTNTGNSIDWYLSLTNQRKQVLSGAVTDMYIYPPIEADADFCGIHCLKEWLNNIVPQINKIEVEYGGNFRYLKLDGTVGSASEDLNNRENNG